LENPSGRNRDLLLTYTFIPFQNVAKGTLAAVGAIRIDALPMFTDIRFFALVHINCRIIRPHNDATSIGTDLAEGLIRFSGAQLTGITPTFSLQGTAAFLFGVISGFG